MTCSRPLWASQFTTASEGECPFAFYASGRAMLRRIWVSLVDHARAQARSQGLASSSTTQPSLTARSRSRASLRSTPHTSLGWARVLGTLMTRRPQVDARTAQRSHRAPQRAGSASGWPSCFCDCAGDGDGERPAKSARAHLHGDGELAARCPIRCGQMPRCRRPRALASSHL